MRRVYRASLPPRTHEWVVVPEDEPPRVGVRAGRPSVRDLHAFVVPVGRRYDLVLTEDLARALENTGDTAGVVFEEIGAIRSGH
jgi:hypothetical protein